MPLFLEYQESSKWIYNRSPIIPYLWTMKFPNWEFCSFKKNKKLNHATIHWALKTMSSHLCILRKGRCSWEVGERGGEHVGSLSKDGVERSVCSGPHGGRQGWGKHAVDVPWGLACSSFAWGKKQGLRRGWLCEILRNRPLGTIARDTVADSAWHSLESLVNTAHQQFLEGLKALGLSLVLQILDEPHRSSHHGPVLCCRRGP